MQGTTEAPLIIAAPLLIKVVGRSFNSDTVADP